VTAVLIVCTGNICRSPTAEGVLRHHLAREGLADKVSVDSAGTEGWHVGDGPSTPAIEIAGQRGYDLRDLCARQLADDDPTRFDLILAMDRGHLSLLKQRMPDAKPEQLRLFMEFAPGGIDEVPDPYYGGPSDYEYSLDLIESAMPGLLEALRRDFP